jgi:hypothetical protein
MKYHSKYRQKQRKQKLPKPQRIYEKFNLFREKKLFRIPILYSEIIKDEYIGKGIVKDETDFLIQAIEEKFERDRVNFIPIEVDLESWEKEVRELYG